MNKFLTGIFGVGFAIWLWNIYLIQPVLSWTFFIPWVISLFMVVIWKHSLLKKAEIPARKPKLRKFK